MEWAALRLDRFDRPSVLRDEMDELSIEPEDRAEASAAKPRRTLGDRFKHRLHVGGRTRDHAEDVAHRRLTLKRFHKVAISHLRLVEKPHVLDRDHRLIGKGFEQLDLPIAERPHLRAPDHQRADGLSLAQ